jgi:hypothetical protein
MIAEGTISEWMRVMLEEIARKKAEEEQWRAEEQQRVEEQRRREEASCARSKQRGCDTVRESAKMNRIW